MWPFGTFRASSAIVAGNSLNALRPLWAFFALESLSAIRTISTVSARRTGVTLWPLGASRTLRAGFSLWALLALWPLSALRARYPNAALAVDHSVSDSRQGRIGTDPVDDLGDIFESRDSIELFKRRLSTLGEGAHTATAANASAHQSGWMSMWSCPRVENPLTTRSKGCDQRPPESEM